MYEENEKMLVEEYLNGEETRCEEDYLLYTPIHSRKAEKIARHKKEEKLFPSDWQECAATKHMSPIKKNKYIKACRRSWHLDGWWSVEMRIIRNRALLPNRILMEEVLEGSMHHPSKMRLHNTKKNFMGKVNGGTNEYSYTKRFPVKNFNSEYLW